MLQKYSRKDTTGEMRQIFATFDADKSGKISSHELKTVLAKMGEKLTDEEGMQI